MGIAPEINRAGRRTDAHVAALEWPVGRTPAACVHADEPERPVTRVPVVNTPTLAHRTQSTIIDP
jgi:hypothetical protein